MHDQIKDPAIRFYLQGNSLKETASFLENEHCYRINPTTLGYHLKKHISLRGVNEGTTLVKRKHINISAILEGYAETKSVRSLSRQSGINRATITKLLNESNIKMLTHDAATRSANLKYEKTCFLGNNQDKAYLYGFVLGDVHVFKKSKFTLRAITHTTRTSFIDLFRDEFNRYGKVNCKRRKNGDWSLWVDSDYGSFCFLEERSKDLLPDWICQSNFFSFLSGLIDSDGSV